jgi:hypothetical protein
MPTSFPTLIDNVFDIPNTPLPNTLLTGPGGLAHASQHANLNSAIKAIETKIGQDNSVDSNSIDYKLKNHVHSVAAGNVAGFRNRIINGVCQVNQYSDITVSATSTSVYGGPDRFFTGNFASGSFTQTRPQSGGEPTLTYSGHKLWTVRNTVMTPHSAFTANQFWSGINQAVEGLNSFDFLGNSITISFIFHTNVTGTFSISFRDNVPGVPGSGTGNSIVSSFSAVANTPVKVTKTFNIPSLWSIPNTSTARSLVSIGFIGGTNVTSLTSDVPIVGNIPGAGGVTDWGSNVGNFIEVTELQVEKGNTATEFERRDIGTELALCRRYAQILPTMHFACYSNAGGNGIAQTVPFTLMRAYPTVSGYVFSGGNFNTPVLAILSHSSLNFTCTATIAGTVEITCNSGTLSAEFF